MSASASASLRGRRASDHGELSSAQIRAPYQQHLTIQQAAQWFEVHPNTVRNWIARGRIPAYQPAGQYGRILIPLEALRSLKTESVAPDARCRLPEGGFLCPNCGSPSGPESIGLASGSSTLGEALNEIRERSKTSKTRRTSPRKSDRPKNGAS